MTLLHMVVPELVPAVELQARICLIGKVLLKAFDNGQRVRPNTVVDHAPELARVVCGHLQTLRLRPMQQVCPYYCCCQPPPVPMGGESAHRGGDDDDDQRDDFDTYEKRNRFCYQDVPRP